MSGRGVDSCPEGRSILDDARSALLVLDIAVKMLLRRARHKPKRANIYSELAGQLKETMQELSATAIATKPPTEVADAVRTGIERSRAAILLLEPRASRSRLSFFFYRLMLLPATIAAPFTRHRPADSLVAARAALAHLDWKLSHLTPPPGPTPTVQQLSAPSGVTALNGGQVPLPPQAPAVEERRRAGLGMLMLL